MKNIALYVIIGICRSKSLPQAIIILEEKCLRVYYIYLQVIRLVGVYTNPANWKKLIRTIHFSLRIHIFGHATKLGCLYFGFRQSNQHRPSFKPYACIPDLFDEIALMFRLLRTISVSCTTFTSQVIYIIGNLPQEIQIVGPSTTNVHGYFKASIFPVSCILKVKSSSFC